MMGLKEYDYSQDELLGAVNVPIRMTGDPSGISIGRALEYLKSLSEVGKEFQGDCDGLDALCYHLDKYTCEDAIKVLQAVLKRFEEL